MRCASWHVGDVKAPRWLPLLAGKRSGAAQVTALRAQVLALSKTEPGAKDLAALGLTGFDARPQLRLMASLDWLGDKQAK